MKYAGILMMGLAGLIAASELQASATPTQSKPYQCPVLEKNSDDHKKLIELFKNRKTSGGQIVTLAGQKFMFKDNSLDDQNGLLGFQANFMNLKGRYNGSECIYYPVESLIALGLIPEENFHLFDEKGKLKPSESERVQKEAIIKIGQDLKVVVENAQKAYPTLSRGQIEKLIVKAIPYSR